MGTLLLLTRPRRLGARHRIQESRLRTLGMVLLGAGLWGAVFAVSRRVLVYFRGIEDIGTILSYKVLSMMLATVFALLLFSAILHALSKLYLSRDLLLVNAFPVPTWKLFLARWCEVVFDSSWMVIGFSLPFLLAFGLVCRAGPAYYGMAVAVMAGLSATAGALGAMAVAAAVVLVPAHRMRNLFLFLGLLLFIGVYVAVRMLKPEQLVDPEAFDSALLYVAALDTGSAGFLPTTWALGALRGCLEGGRWRGALDLALIWTFAGFCCFSMLAAADRLYGRGLSKAQASGRRAVGAAGWVRRPPLPVPPAVRAVTGKELLFFLRDQAQWSQLFLIGALMLVYIYNFKVLPLERAPIQTVYLQNLLGFLNMGLALFVVAAVSARFAYPAVSAEQEAFWVIRVSPLPLRRFLWIKFGVYYLPLLVMTEGLVVTTNLLLHVSPFLMCLSVATVFALVPGVVALGIGLGAAFPDFKAENPVQTVTGFGGLLYMVSCAFLIGSVLVLQAGPVHAILVAGLKGRPLNAANLVWAVAAFAICGALCLLSVWMPMAMGVKRLENLRR